MKRSNEAVLTLKEKVDIVKLMKLLASKEITVEEKNTLYKYKKLVNSEGYAQVNYNYSKNMTVGRLYADKSLSYQSFRRSIRATLANDFYYDVDMCNAAPTMLYQYCKKKGIHCVMLERYVKFRDNWFDEIMKVYEVDRNKAKKLMMRLVHLGSYQVSMKDSDDVYEPTMKIQKLVNFAKEMINIGNRLYTTEEDIRKIVESDDDKINKVASLISIKCQILEKECLDNAINFFRSKGFIIGTLCFDGCLIEKKNKITEELLKECSTYVHSKTGYKIVFTVKEMTDIMELPKETALIGENKDIEVQQKLFRLVNPKNFQYCNRMLYVYNEDVGMFEMSDERNTEPLDSYIVKYKEYFYMESKSKCEFSDLLNYGHTEKLLGKSLKHVRVASKNNDWIDETANTSLFKLLFKDCIYDMKEKRKIPFDPNIVFHYNIPHKFPQRNEEEIKYAYELSFKVICGDIGDDGYKNELMDPTKPETIPLSMPLRVAIARAIAGDIEAKKFYFCPGRTNAGKSALVKMLTKCFGKFIQTFNAENLAHKDKGSSADSAQNMRWALLQRFARVLFSNEVNMKVTLNGNEIKKFSSAGDEITGRTHCKEEETFTPQFTLFSMLNDIPAIVPMDDAVRERLIYYEFPRQFVAPGKVEDPSYQIVGDSELTKKINEPKFINGFIHLMLDAYNYFMEKGQPVFNTKAKDEWTDGDNKEAEIYETILSQFTITKNMKDFVTLLDFNTFKKRYGKTFTDISVKRINEILNKFGILKGKTTGGQRVYRGIRWGETEIKDELVAGEEKGTNVKFTNVINDSMDFDFDSEDDEN